MSVSDLDPRPNASTSLDPSNPAWNAPQGLRIFGDVYLIAGSAAPVNGTTGSGFAGTSSLYFRTDAAEVYINTGTFSATVWAAVYP
jgi:hypothetical protein